MKTKTFVIALLTASLLLAIMFSIVPTLSTRPYNPWMDVDNNGKIDMIDLWWVQQSYGTMGTPVAKAALLYDSGWLNIIDRCGQNITVNHGLNLTLDDPALSFDITGKTALDSPNILRYLGLTNRIPGWNKTYGGTGDEFALALIQTADGGYALAGYTTSYSAGNDDFWLVKTDAYGNAQWSNTYGGTGYDEAWALVQTADGGYALAGYTTSYSAGGSDFWLVKTDANGNMQWNETYGGTGWEWAYALVQTGDGDYVLAGYTESYGAGPQDSWLVKTDASGNALWNTTYGGTDYDSCHALVQTADGGYALAGATTSYGVGGDFWLVKTDGYGNTQWNNTYGGTGSDSAYALVQTADGGYALAGITESYSAGGYDAFWLVKTDAYGNAQWNKTYQGTGSSDEAWALVQTADGGYAMTGLTSSYSGFDFWLVKTDGYGNAQWNNTYGGADVDWAWALVQTADGGYALAGMTTSYGAGGLDFWLVKTSVEMGFVWVDSTASTLTLYRGATDPYWNYVRVQIWKRK